MKTKQKEKTNTEIEMKKINKNETYFCIANFRIFIIAVFGSLGGYKTVWRTHNTIDTINNWFGCVYCAEL